LGRKIFISDCEGPISINDNAFELAGHFIDDGEKFFAIVSKYDDILADEIRRPGYNAGDTLKLIVPFLKAYGATNRNIIEFSAKNVLLIPKAKDTLQFVNRIMPSFIVSTSYEHYIRALCDLTGFPYKNTYSTKLDIDSHPISAEEKERLMELRKIIIENPDFDVLDKIFWKDIPSMEIGKIVNEVKTVGGEGKKEAIREILNKHGFKASNVMYVGDSITDVQPFQFARESGGLAISFNGNEYAIREAEIAIIADNTLIISLIADLFNKFGRNYVIEFVTDFSIKPDSALKNYRINLDLLEKIQNTKIPKMAIITKQNAEKLIKKSTMFRKKVRGESIGGLG